MRILTVPEDFDALRQKSESVKQLDEKLIKFLTNLGETLKCQEDPGGSGLSAVQVGWPIRVMATLLPQEFNGPTLRTQGRTLPELTFYLNPEIIEHSKEKTLGDELVKSDKPDDADAKPFLEGCLSVPDTYGPVLRWPWIKAKAVILSEADLRSKNLALRTADFELEKLEARVFQHELDHLNGILFTDHVLSQGGQLYHQVGEELEAMRL